MLGMETPDFIFFVVTLAVGVAAYVLGKIAPKTETKVDDQVLGWIIEAKTLLDRWNDPEDPAVPPSPSNPTGKA